MRTSKFTPEQTVAICRQGESGVPVVEVCRQHGISEQTYYRWKKQLGDISSAELKELRQLRDENRKLKTLVADLTLDNDPSGGAHKNILTPIRWWVLVGWVERSYRLTQRRACGALGAARSSVRYIGVRPPQEALRARLRELAAVRVSYGYPRLTILLRRERGGM
jgi:putative transposase